MKGLKHYKFWFITGSQYLYGEETLLKVAEHSRAITVFFNNNPEIPYEVVYKDTVKTEEEVRRLMEEANNDDSCAGIISWMHTFSPAKMWITGLSALKKPLLHLHTQFNRDIPWDTIDMDFMNLNQSAHGDREYGFIGARLRLKRKVVVGHWSDPEVIHRLRVWMDASIGYVEGRKLKVARFGDNMRQVAVTEGDKVEAQIKFGWSVDGYGLGDLVSLVDKVTDSQAEDLYNEYSNLYDITPAAETDSDVRDAIKEQAKIEIALKQFLDEGGYGAFTTTFENLHGLKQLPGLAVQRLMEQGYGFGAEGDWKTAALLRIMKLMSGAEGNKGTSFMEDYTYHLEPNNEMILGAHMLEVCPTIAAKRPKIEVHPLGIGGKSDPARMIFESKTGPAICASLVDLGDRFRLIVNEVDAVKQEKDMPRLPVASALWKPRPSLKEAAEAWILAGGAHHTVFSFDITNEHMLDWAEANGIECLTIDNETEIKSFRNLLRWSDLYWSFYSRKY